jgi:phage-related holin
MTEINIIAGQAKGIATGLLKVYTTKKTIFTAAAMAAGYAAFKAAFIQHHKISFELTMALVYMVLMDTGLGLWKHHKQNQVSSKGFAAFFTKLLLYYCVLKVANWLALIPLLGITGDVIICGMMVRETISIGENIEAIQPGTLPKWLVKRLKDFDDDGQINQSNQATTEGGNNNAGPSQN